MTTHFAKRRIRVEAPDEHGELNVVPYLDILMNLIVFMLLSLTGLATFGVINASAPTSSVPGLRAERRLTVSIDAEGFVVDGRRVPLTLVGSHDLDALATRLVELKSAEPAVTRVVVSAEAGISFALLTATLDTTRETRDHQPLFPDVTLADR